MRVKPLRLLSLAILSLSGLSLVAQSTPVVNPAYTGATMVSGHATPGQAPVIVYDTTNSGRTALGTGHSMDKAGNFAVILTSPLIVGHSIIVVDNSGAASAAVVVVVRPNSVSHP